MTDTPRDASDIADYRLAVERHLADLPTPIREDLLNELEAHLSEIAAELEPGADLAERLGSPEAYARELRETAEIPRESAGNRFRRSMWKMMDPSLIWVRGLADRFTDSAGVGGAGEFRKTLRPAWWVLRGLIAAALVLHLVVFGDEALRAAVLRLGFIGLLFVVTVALAFVWLSLKLGVRSEGWSRRNRRITATGGIVLVALSLLNFSWIADGFVFHQDDPGVDYIEVDGDPYSDVTDVYVYSEDGELLTGVYLFDQNGDPLRIGDPRACEDGRGDNAFEDEEVTSDPFATTAAPRDEDVYGYQYPLCAITGDQPEGAAEASPSPESTDEPTTEAPTTEPAAEPTTEGPTPSETPTE